MEFLSQFNSMEFEFVPTETVEQLKGFYREPFRTFEDWRLNHAQTLSHGQTVTICGDYQADNALVYGHSDHDGITGKFVFMWNNIGRVIANNKAYYCFFYPKIIFSSKVC